MGYRPYMQEEEVDKGSDSGEVEAGLWRDRSTAAGNGWD